MASRRQTGAVAAHPSAAEALVAAAMSSLADQFPSAITGRSLAEKAGVHYGQLHRHFGSKTAVFAAAFEQLMGDYVDAGVDEQGIPRPLGFRDSPTFWRALTHLMLDRATFEAFRPSSGVLARATLGVQRRRPELNPTQAKAVVALGVSLEFGMLIHRELLGAAVGLRPDEPEVDRCLRVWLGGLYEGSGPLGGIPVASSTSVIRSRDSGWSNTPIGADGVEPTVEQRLVDAGARLLEDRAPSAISGRQLAREAGVNYGLIHHYFGTKDEVLRRAVQLHRDRFFAAYGDERRAPGYFSVCDHTGYVRAMTWAAIDPSLSGADQRFPVMDLLLDKWLTEAVGQQRRVGDAGGGLRGRRDADGVGVVRRPVRASARRRPGRTGTARGPAVASFAASSGDRTRPGRMTRAHDPGP